MNDDLISRQAAIDAIHDKFDECLVWDDSGEYYVHSTVDVVEDILTYLPSVQPEIIYCKDCRKHNKYHGHYCDGTYVGILDCCPLIEVRGMARGHEFDYQYCVYAERRQDD